MDTIRLFLSIRLNINSIKKSKIKWKPFIQNNELIYNCTYNGVTLTYYPNKWALSLKCSATKFLYGNNQADFNYNDLERLYTNLDLVIRILIKEEVKTVRQWIITRLDLVCNYICKSEIDKFTYLKTISKIPFHRCKNNININTNNITSVHHSNKSITYNIYSKSDQDSTASNKILRLEIQFKNRSLNNLVRNNTLKNKIFEEVMSNTKAINFMYKKRLDSLGLSKKFLTKPEMSTFLKKLYKENTITKRLYKNMFSYFIEQDHSIPNTTLNNYKKVLNTFNYSNLLLENTVIKHIDFLKFNLFKTTKRFKNNLFILIILLLLVLNYIKTKYNSIISNICKNIFFKSIEIIDDS